MCVVLNHSEDNHSKTSIINEITAAFVTPIGMIAKVFSLSALIFSGPLTDNLPVGIGYSLIGAAVLTILFALLSELPFAIAVPESRTAAILAYFALQTSEIMAQHGHAYQSGPTVLAGLILCSFIVGLVTFIFGYFKLSKYIRFIPFPLIGGFLAASGWIIIDGSVRILTKQHVSIGLLEASPYALINLGLGIFFAITLLLTKKNKNPLLFPMVLIVFGVVLYNLIGSFGYSQLAAQNNGWLMTLPASPTFPMQWLYEFRENIHLSALLEPGWTYGAVTMMAAVQLSTEVMAIETRLSRDIDLDHEFRVNGLANIFSGITGGSLGAISSNRTVFHYELGGRKRWSAICAGLLCLSPFVIDKSFFSYIPVSILAGLLLQTGLELLYEWFFCSFRKLKKIDYLQLFIVFWAITFYGYFIGVFVGIVVACVSFTLSMSRINPLRFLVSRKSISSRVDRPIGQAEILQQHGDSIQLAVLQGYIFFGSCHSLLEKIKSTILLTPDQCKSLIIDFKKVVGIDASAIASFKKLRNFSKNMKFNLVFSGLSESIKKSLIDGDVISDSGNGLIKLFPTLDIALETSEEDCLKDYSVSINDHHSMENWLSLELGSVQRFQMLKNYAELINYKPGDRLCEQNEVSNNIFMIGAGRVSVVFQDTSGKSTRVRSMMGNSIVGEMSFYRETKHVATVQAEEQTVVYKLSKENMALMSKENPDLSAAFQAFIIRTLSTRLDLLLHDMNDLEL